MFESQVFGSLTTTVGPYHYFENVGGLFRPGGNTAKSSRSQLSEVASKSPPITFNPEELSHCETRWLSAWIARGWDTHPMHGVLPGCAPPNPTLRDHPRKRGGAALFHKL